MSSYPKLLYRPGQEELCWGVMVDTLRVHDPAERDAALADGWYLEPVFDAPSAPTPGLLDNNAATIIAALSDLTADELKALKADEITGKTRKGVIAAIDAALAAQET